MSELDDYVDALMYNADRPEGRLNLSNFYLMLSQTAAAERFYRSAISAEPELSQAYVNLADLYRGQRRDQEAERILREGLQQSDDRAPLHHAPGLALVRLKKMDDAMRQLQKATEQDPAEIRYAYVYGVALRSRKGPQSAIRYLEKINQGQSGDLNVLLALATYCLEAGKQDQARGYVKDILQLVPRHAAARKLLNELGPE